MYEVINFRPDEEGVFGERDLKDGRIAHLVLNTFGGASIKVGPKGRQWYDEFWDYEALNVAIHQLATWNPQAEREPEGWVRHVPSYRRRPDGDKAREHVRY
jgi:hypothetical protein